MYLWLTFKFDFYWSVLLTVVFETLHKIFIEVLVHTALLLAGLGGSVGCAVRLETRRSQVQPPPRWATFFRGD